MNRRRFIQSATAFFAALAGTGPKLLEQRPQFTGGAPVVLPKGWDATLLPNGEQIITLNRDGPPASSVVLDGRVINRAIRAMSKEGRLYPFRRRR